MSITYVTGNKNKFENAKSYFTSQNIEIEQHMLSLSEIQGNDSVEIAIDKACRAWEKLSQPLFVNDASWIIPALKGFPGPYMKYVNEWFEPADFIHLMEDKEDRRIILKDIIVYVDNDGHRVFTNEHYGTVLEHIADVSYRHPSDVVISLSKNGSSIGEEVKKGTFFIEGEDKVWVEFVNWLKDKKYNLTKMF